LADLSVSLQMTSSDLGGSLLFINTSFVAERPNLTWQHIWGRCLFLDGQARPTQRGVPPRCQIFGVPFYLCVHLLTQNYQFWRGNTIRRGLFLRLSQASALRGGVPVLPNFGGSFLFTHIPFDVNYQTSRGNTYDEGLVLSGQPPRRGVVLALRSFGVPFYFCVQLLSQNYIWRGNTCRGGACILWLTTLPTPRKRSFSVPQFWVFSCDVLCLHLLTQNDQIQHGNTWRKPCL